MNRVLKLFDGKHNTIFILFGFFIALLSGTAVAQQAPAINVSDLSGKSLKVSDFKGQVVYVDFWATWCPPCRKSFPWMETMHKRYEDLGLKIIAISLDNKRELVDEYLKSTPASFTIAHDPSGKSAEAFKVVGMPSSYIVDKHGNIHSSHAGFKESDKAKLEAEIKNLLISD